MAAVRQLTITLAAVSLLAAGCLGNGDTDTTSRRPLPDTDLVTQTTALYLTEDMGLQRASPTNPEPGRVTAPSFYRTWTEGEDQPTFTNGPLSSGVVVSEVRLTFFYTASEAVATTGPQDQGFPEFVVYFGSTEAPMAWASVQGPDVVSQDEAVKVDVVLEVPVGGLVIPPGGVPTVIISPVQAQQDVAFQLDLLVNGTETPSNVRLTAHAADFPTQGKEDTTRDSGRLLGSAYVLGASEGTTAALHEFEVTSELKGVQLRLERSTGAGVADIDLEVLAPNGTVIARSVTPMPHEGIDLYHPNLDAGGAGTWTARVVNYGNAVVEYDLTITRINGSPAA